MSDFRQDTASCLHYAQGVNVKATKHKRIDQQQKQKIKREKRQQVKPVTEK